MREELAELYVGFFPYVAAARLRRARTVPDDPFRPGPATSPGAPLNRVGRQRRTSDPTYRAGVGVSTATLYTSAWLDLAGGPLVLEGFDTVVLASGFDSDDTLHQARRGPLLELRPMGDAYAPRRPAFATRQAYAPAESLAGTA